MANTVVFNIKADSAQLVKGLTSAQRSMQKSVDSMKKTVIGLAAAYVSVQTAIKGFEIAQRQAVQMVGVAANFEKFDAVLRTIEGSSQKAKESLKWVQDFASVTPFNIDKVTSSFISLKSYGLDPTDGLLRTLGDTSAAMGKDIQQAVEAMADAVVGENERLKEFGIRANVTGDQIKYSWTNASGEMRQTIIDNNSAVIESTLSAIFNSKYAGAMEMQSKTWNGLMSNMEDNLTIFQKNIMDGGLFDYLKAIVTVAGEYMKNAFKNAEESSVDFSVTTIEALKNVIKGTGILYDVLEGVGDFFKFVGYSAELAFYGIQVVSSTATLALYTGWQSFSNGIIDFFEIALNGIQNGFESTINFIISGINLAIDGMNALGAGLNYVGTISFEDVNLKKVYLETEIKTLLSSRIEPVTQGYNDTREKYMTTYDDLFTSGGGSGLADKFIIDIDTALEKIKDKQIENSQVTSDFGESVPDPKITEKEKEVYSDYKVDTDILESVNKQTNYVNDNFSNLNDTLSNSSDDSDTYTVVNNVADSFNNLNDTTTQTVSAIDNVSSALDTFIFAFSDTFLNSITSNINSLKSIGTGSSFNSLSYSDALFNVNEKRDQLIANPLDVTIGAQYKEAYDIFINAASDYLGDMSNFSSAQHYAFAQASVGSQASILEDTALQTVDVLESMNLFLESINQAFSDGILSDEEKLTIAGVADVVNAKNETLLGNSSVVVSGLNGIPESISSQTYYDNNGLATDANISAQEYFNNLGLATDAQIAAQTYYNNTGLATDSNISAQEYFNNTGLATDTNISAQEYFNNTGLATTVSTNSIKDTVAKLMGGASSGISLTSVASTLPSLSVSTGLDVSKLSNLDSIKTNTANTSTNANNTKNAVNTMAGGETLKSLILKNATTTTSYYTKSPWTGGVETTAYNAGYTVESTSYTYYAKGGFTGPGMGMIDETGQRQAGIVHEDEWVAPSWMVKSNPALFGALEMQRLGKNNFRSSYSSSGDSRNDNGYMFVVATELKDMNSLLRRVTEGGEAMNIKAIS